MFRLYGLGFRTQDRGLGRDARIRFNFCVAPSYSECVAGIAAYCRCSSGCRVGLGFGARGC